ncbi:membrane integrity-associated transporter subunit PqiC [Pseudomonas sp. NPDC089758]|uniref:PqiC family protein n=1 Tax=Pseudomonas sp. NPDC089758 TaxID=3364473 RepID=UPI003812212D
MTPLPRITLLVALMTLGACRSDPIQFHTLTPAMPAPSSHAATDEILLESVSVPPQVDRPQLVIRQGNSSLAILETQWWGATLVDELRSALIDQLSNTRPARKLSLRVDVQRFDSVPGQYALLDARWRLRARGADAQLTCRSTLQTAAGNSIDDVVIAQQANVKRLVALISQAASSTNSTCPVER